MAIQPEEATLLLHRMNAGEKGAAEKLLPLLYEELRRLAEACMRSEADDHTLQPTALVHEVWMRTLGAEDTRNFNGRAHFLRTAAMAMRHVLVDHARARSAAKRGGGDRGTGLDEVLLTFEEQDIDIVELNDAISKLASMDEELARLVELRYFAGLTIAETAEIMEVSTNTVERSWRVARMWLRKLLDPQ